MCGTCTLTCNCCQATLCNDHLYFMKLLTMPQDGCLLSLPALPAITPSSEACKEPSLTQKCKQTAVVYGQPSKHYLHALLPTLCDYFMDTVLVCCSWRPQTGESRGKLPCGLSNWIMDQFSPDFSPSGTSELKQVVLHFFRHMYFNH